MLYKLEKMENHHCFSLVLFFGAITIIHLVQTQAQEGFINLDCGLPLDESPYTDATTGLTFSSDANFVRSGKRGEVTSSFSSLYGRQYKDLRYFPDGQRNCYNLTVNKGVNYLIRTGFSYGNYDGLNTYPKFDIYIGSNMWTSVVVESDEFREIIYMTKSNLLEICLVKTGETTPVISTLELRPFKNDSYVTKLGPLNLLYRRSYASSSLGYIRYPDDVYDRIWDRYSLLETDVNTTSNVSSSNPFAVPDAVSRSGVSPLNTTRPMRFLSFSDGNNDKFSVYFHFAEIQVLKMSDIREFDVLLEGNVVSKAYSPKFLQSETKYNISPTKCGLSICYLDLVRTQRSTLPPLINAIEAFTVLEFPYAETNQTDVAAMRNIEAIYGLNLISWQGDPCLPEALTWEGLKCSYTNKSTSPRITSLDLSSHGLKGVITPAFQNLTELQELDLSNNGLTGGVPEFLASMKSLSIIDLSWNNLTGPLPTTFQNRVKNGLKLTTQGNPKLSGDASCNNRNQNYILPFVALAASVLIIWYV